MTRKNTQNMVQKLGQDIAKLILDLQLPEEVKLAWADSVPRMTQEQLASAVEMLNLHAVEDMQDKVSDVQKRYIELVSTIN